MLPASISTSSESPQLPVLTPDDNKYPHDMKKYEPYGGRIKIWYCSRKHDENMLQKIGSIAPHPLINPINFVTVMGFPGIIYIWGIASCNINIVWPIFSWLTCLPHFHPLLYLLKSFLWFFSSFSIDNSLLKSFRMICLDFLPYVVLLTFSMHEITGLSDNSAALTIFMPITDF